MRIFDSHCHIDDKSYDDDFQETLDRAKDNRVIACMIVGITLKTCRKAVPLCEASANCLYFGGGASSRRQVVQRKGS